MPLDHNWFTEVAPEEGVALSLKGARRLHAEQTEYQKIEIYETASFGTLMVIDGCIMLTDRDNFVYHEMMAHPVLFTHPAPRDVLIVGGGDCGTLQQVLLHPDIERVTQAEIDERVTRLSEEYFPDLCAANGDPRAHFHFDDAIKWIKSARAGSLDVVIVDSTDPVGPAEGLFSASFYKECRRALRPGGLIVQQSESPLLYLPIITAMHKELNKAGYPGISTLLFPQCTYPSGWWSATMACKDGPIPEFRRVAAEQRGFETRYYDAGIHAAAFALPPFLRKALTGGAG